MRTRILVPATLVLALTGAMLTACSGSAGPASSSPGSQSTADACASVVSSVSDATGRLRTLDTSDPSASGAALRDVADRLGSAADALHNADVSALISPLRTGFDDASTALQGLAVGDLAQLPALERATSGIQTALTRFAEVCGAP
ncbi:hypothetical protein [Microbacterium dextranolyticum]|uniref:hypothetical protein n=1 Tax=Microbacterium dextranolyticum TaxID=36806 RepID=UPI00195E0817|nr:hypothetical protein [Microbacterium dextranolyticum]MBM7463851.1 hypothetical protein [Microbacterium dextranolyticum]